MVVRTWLVKRRRELGKTQQQVADMIGISKSSYCSIELGTKDPRLKTAIKISRALRFELNEFDDRNVS